MQTGLEQATFEQKRKLVELLIDRVIVTDENVEIRYVIPISPENEHSRFCHLRKDYFDIEALVVPVNGFVRKFEIGDQVERMSEPSFPDGNYNLC